MSDIAIRVENLGKTYLLAHQGTKGGRFRYQRFSDKIINACKAPFTYAQKLASGRAEGGDTVEEFWALKDVSFEIKQGEAVGVIGRNGAGKSTLLKLLSRITEPATGRIELEGRIASLLEVGTGFHPELTGRENIYLNGAILGMSRAEIAKKFDEIVAFAEVERFLDTPVKRYSSGMYMRLAFAVAAHLEPEILVVDEVLAVGDAAFQNKCLGKMQEVGKSGRTVLFVSHNTEALSRLCTSCLYLVNGQLKMQGETRAVIQEYAEHFRQATGEIDLTTLPRRFESNGKGRLLRLRSLQGEANTSWCFEYGAPLSFEVDFSVDQKLKAPEIGYAIFALSGMELASSTTYQENPLDELAPGQYRMRISLNDFPISPGKYLLGLGIASEERSVDHIGEAAQFEILPTTESAQKGIYKIWAPFIPKTTFQLTSV